MTYISRDVLELRRQLEEHKKRNSELDYCLRVAEGEVASLRIKIQDKD